MGDQTQLMCGAFKPFTSILSRIFIKRKERVYFIVGLLRQRAPSPQSTFHPGSFVSLKLHAPDAIAKNYRAVWTVKTLYWSWLNFSADKKQQYNIFPCFHHDMQPATMDPADEPASMLWGLDPIFSAFARLYVRDILQMAESTQVPGIYFYNLHPISKVDVLGTVVYKRERDDFFCYGVDDGTGVINCLCWKNNLMKEAEGPSKSGKHSDGAEGGFNPVAELEKLRQAQQALCHLEIGELLRVRGPVKTSRQQREIMASTFYKVNDPVMAVQIAWMMEVPLLYRQFYDKLLELRPNATGDSALSSVSKATKIIKDFLKQRSVPRFRPYDVLELLEPLISSQPQTTSADAEPVAGPSGCQKLRQLLKEVLQILQDEGVVYRKVKSQDEVYHATAHDTDLRIVVKDVIREDSKREKFAEKGCHVLHILSAVRNRHSPNVSKAALELVLKSLECNSDIVSTSDSHYTAF